jgi:glycosyltransferase involved in cell wall biosynthesis
VASMIVCILLGFRFAAIALWAPPTLCRLSRYRESISSRVMSFLSVSAFFPCYNDGGTIGRVVILANKTLQEVADDYEIIVVDDGSTDHSLNVLEELLRSSKVPLRLVCHPQNRGYGGALRTGFAEATKDWVFYTDGDAQYDVAELRKLLALVDDGVDVVQGYKLKRQDPWHRVLIGAAYRRVACMLFSLKIRDVDCDFRLLRRSVLQKVELRHNSGVVCLELVRKLQDVGARFVEVPVHHYCRSYGYSQFFTPRRIAEVGIDMVRLWWRLVVRHTAAGSR